MNTVLVGYDLNRPGQNYEELIDWLKQHTWWHHLDSTWLIRTTRSASEVRDEVKRFIDAGDEVLVINVTGDAWATFGISNTGNDWLHQNM